MGTTVSASFRKIYVFIYLAVLDISCSMWDLVPQPGMEPQAPCIGRMES